MDCTKVGALIRALRRAQGLTQLALAEKLCVSDKAVSKWERGLGCPDVSLLPALTGILGVSPEALLAGQLAENDPVGGNMKKLKFYVCPDCGNLLTAAAEADVCCCGKKLAPLAPQKAEEALSLERIEGDWFLSSPHEMTKSHHISFVAFLSGDTLLVRKLYPEWDMQTRIPAMGHGTLLWYCTQHGLFYRLV